MKAHEKDLAAARANNRRQQRHIKERVFEILGRKCVRCGFDDVRALQVDHIEGGGSRERKEKGTWTVYYNVVKTGGKGYQILCANCNVIKRIEKKEGPRRIGDE